MTQHINPYTKHGCKQDNVKKITVSIKNEVYNAVQQELKRRKDNKMKHATASDIICEAFVHAYTGQPLPTDKELYRYISKAKAEKYQDYENRTRDDNINNAITIAERYVSLQNFHKVFKTVLELETSADGTKIQATERALLLHRIFNIVLTFALTDTLTQYQLRKESSDELSRVNKDQKYAELLDFIDYCEKSNNRNAHIAKEVKEVLK